MFLRDLVIILAAAVAVMTARISLGGEAAVTIAGRADRILTVAGGTAAADSIVDDYKTRGDISAKLRPSSILRGLHLQVPLYREALAESRAPWEPGSPSFALIDS